MQHFTPTLSLLCLPTVNEPQLLISVLTSLSQPGRTTAQRRHPVDESGNQPLSPEKRYVAYITLEARSFHHRHLFGFLFLFFHKDIRSTLFVIFDKCIMNGHSLIPDPTIPKRHTTNGQFKISALHLFTPLSPQQGYDIYTSRCASAGTKLHSNPPDKE